MPVEKYALDYTQAHVSNGDDDVHDSEIPSYRDVEDGRRTDFDPSDASDSQRYRELRRRWNELDSGAGKERHDADKVRLVHIVCGNCDVASASRDRIVRIVTSLDIHELHATASIEAVVLAVTTLVANEDLRWIRQEQCFDEIRTDFDISRDRIRQLRQRLRETDVYTSPST